MWRNPLIDTSFKKENKNIWSQVSDLQLSLQSIELHFYPPFLLARNESDGGFFFPPRHINVVFLLCDILSGILPSV